MWRPRFTIRWLMGCVALVALAATGPSWRMLVVMLLGGLVAARLGRRRWRLAKAAGAVLWGPVTFLAVLFGLNVINGCLGWWEVSNYIREHQAIVARRLTDPSVHSFALSHDPVDRGRLRVRFDVDDRITYEMLESDLSDADSLRFTPHWQTTMRSHERLGGIDLRGMDEGVIEFFIAALAALCVSLTLLVLAICSPRPPASSNGTVSTESDRT